MKVVHTADTHLGYRQYGSDTRRRDFHKAFETVVDDAVEMGVDAFVHAGDLFHNRNPDLRDIIPTIHTLERLRDAGIPVLAVVGNHERKRDAQWLDLFQDLGLVERLDSTPVVVRDVAFYGVDYVPGSRIDDYDYNFEETDAAYNVLVLHGRFEPFPYGEWDLQRFHDAAVEWDAFLLGDYHHFEKERVGDAWASYCGSTERVSAEERESRGYNVVEFGDDVGFTRRSLPTREFVFVEADVTGVEGDATPRVVERVAEYNVEDSIVIVEVDGDSDAPVVQSEVEEAVLDRGALVVRVKDRRSVEAEIGDVEVSFMDPDEAVRERVSEMRLSGAAHSIEALVRDGDVPDTRVTEEVESRMEDIVESDAEELSRPVEDDRETSDDGEGGKVDGEPEGDSAEEEERGTESVAAAGEGQRSMEDFT